jgi:archaellum component FlaC
MAKIKKGEHEREEKVKELDSNLKKLSRKYENLLK